MPVITLDNEQLKAAVAETILQIAGGIAQAECGTGLSVGKKYKVSFQATIVAKSGLNAVPRVQASATTAEKVSTTIDEAVVERSTRAGNQTTTTHEDSTTDSTDKQTGSTSETGTQKESGSTTEAATNKSTSKDATASKSDATTKEDNTSKQESTNAQSTGRGTSTTTTTEYTQ